MNNNLFVVIRYQGKLVRIHRVEIAETTIGRFQTNVLRLSDPWISPHHAVLIQTPTKFVIRDLKSRNGTRLNGRPIVEEVLPAVAMIEIGPYELKLCHKLDVAQVEVDDAEESTRNLPMFFLTNSEAQRREQQLTPAQRRVYDELLLGHSEKEAARVLTISVNTVNTHAQAIYDIFNVFSRPELLSLCARHPAPHDCEP